MWPELELPRHMMLAARRLEDFISVAKSYSQQRRHSPLKHNASLHAEVAGEQFMVLQVSTALSA